MSASVLLMAGGGVVPVPVSIYIWGALDGY